MKLSAPDPTPFPASLHLAVMLEKDLLDNTLPPGILTEADGSPADPSRLTAATLIAAGAMAVLRQAEPDNPACDNPAEAVAALFRRKGLQRRVTEHLPDLELPESYKRLGELRKKAQSSSVHVGSLVAGEEMTLEYATDHGEQSRLVVMRCQNGNAISDYGMVIIDASGRTIVGGKIFQRSKLTPGRIVWPGYSTEPYFTSEFTKGTNPSWSRKPTYDEEEKTWMYPDVCTDRKTTLRQIYYGRGTGLPLF